MTLAEQTDVAASGITAHTSPEHRYELVVHHFSDRRKATFRRRVADLVTEDTADLPGSGPVDLETDGHSYRFRVASDGTTCTWDGAAPLLDPDITHGSAACEWASSPPALPKVDPSSPQSAASTSTDTALLMSTGHRWRRDWAKSQSITTSFS